jgi:hypothetical protein
MSADPRLQSDELSMRQPDAPPKGDDLAEDSKDPYAGLVELLVAEWQPEGFTERQVIVELAALYWKLGEIRPYHMTEGSKVAPGLRDAGEAQEDDGEAQEDDGEAQADEDQVNAEEERQDALFAMAMRIGWEGSPEQQVRRQRAALGDLIEKKIQQLIFLQTAKRRLRDPSSQRTTVAQPDRSRLPRGDYRIPVKDRTNPKSEAPARSDQTTVSG